MGEQTKQNVLVLLSGGIDSTAILNFYLKLNANVCAIYFDYGQPSAKEEWKAATAVCQHYRIRLDKIKCTCIREFSDGLIMGRNAFLLHGALMQFQANTGIIAMGIHSGTDYYDCSNDFYLKMQSLFDAYTDGRISFGAPFLSWTKDEIWHYCKHENVPVSYTYSCERGGLIPCGHCNSCKDLEVLFAS